MPSNRSSCYVPTLATPSGVQMEDLVDDLPFAIDFQKREQVGEPVPGPVFEFKPHGGDRVNEVDAGYPCMEPRCRTVLVVSGKELLDRAGDQVGTEITEDRRVLVEGGFHVVASAGLGTIDVVLDDLGDCAVLAHVGCCITHGF